MDNRIVGIIGGISVLLALIIVSAPPVRSVLKTATLRVVAAGLLAEAFVTLGLMVGRFVLRAD